MTLIGLSFIYLLGGCYAAVLIWFWLGLLRLSRDRDRRVDERPPVSIIVAGRNEEATVQSCLRSLLAQDYPDYEVIFVDDHSEDATYEIARAIDHPRLTVIRSDPADLVPLTGKQIALDVGIRLSRGDIILTTDADCCPPPTWVDRMVRGFAPDVGVVTGFSTLDLTHRPRSLFLRLQAAELLALFSAFAGAIRQGIGWACTGNNLAYRKAVYQDIGGFQKIGFTVAEDNILLQRVATDRRWRIVPVCDPAALVVTRAAPDVPAFIRQRIRWASNTLANRPSLTIFMVAVYGFYLLLPVAVGLAAFGQVAWLPVIGLLALKCTPELLLLTAGFRLFRCRGYLWLFPILQFAQAAYVLICGIVGLSRRGVWKGRRF